MLKNRRIKTFTEKVVEVVKNIPKGKVLSYKEVAKLAGTANAYRAVGNILAKNFNKNIPCHRVIKSSGKIGKYNRGGEIVKSKILKKEGYLQKYKNK